MKPLLVFTFGLFVTSSIASAAGAENLIRLYEEEVLAHDLYVALGKEFPEVMPLKNIPHSELRHQAIMAAVLKAEGIEAPQAPKGRRFATKGLDKTYRKWLKEGKKSAADACRVGVRLEDHDIADLRNAQVDFPAHKKSFALLEAASNNHLRAFLFNLKVRGGEYTPEALTEADFNAIINRTTKPAAGCAAACAPASTEATEKSTGKGKVKQRKGKR